MTAIEIHWKMHWERIAWEKWVEQKRKANVRQ